MGKYRVLIVEDDAALRNTLSEVLARNGFDAEQSVDGQDAARENSKMPSRFGACWT